MKWLLPQTMSAPGVPPEPPTAPPEKLNPRMYQDARSGVLVTEYRDADNQIFSQSPPKVVLAYLRAGLGADGFPEKSNNQTEMDNRDALTLDRRI